MHSALYTDNTLNRALTLVSGLTVANDEWSVTVSECQMIPFYQIAHTTPVVDDGCSNSSNSGYWIVQKQRKFIHNLYQYHTRTHKHTHAR